MNVLSMSKDWKPFHLGAAQVFSKLFHSETKSIANELPSTGHSNID